MNGRVGSMRSNEGVWRVKYSTYPNYYFILFIGIIKGIIKGKRGIEGFSSFVTLEKRRERGKEWKSPEFEEPTR